MLSLSLVPRNITPPLSAIVQGDLAAPKTKTEEKSCPKTIAHDAKEPESQTSEKNKYHPYDMFYGGEPKKILKFAELDEVLIKNYNRDEILAVVSIINENAVLTDKMLRLMQKNGGPGVVRSNLKFTEERRCYDAMCLACFDLGIIKGFLLASSHAKTEILHKMKPYKGSWCAMMTVNPYIMTFMLKSLIYKVREDLFLDAQTVAWKKANPTEFEKYTKRYVYPYLLRFLKDNYGITVDPKVKDKTDPREMFLTRDLYDRQLFLLKDLTDNLKPYNDEELMAMLAFVSRDKELFKKVIKRMPISRSSKLEWGYLQETEKEYDYNFVKFMRACIKVSKKPESQAASFLAQMCAKQKVWEFFFKAYPPIFLHIQGALIQRIKQGNYSDKKAFAEFFTKFL